MLVCFVFAKEMLLTSFVLCCEERTLCVGLIAASEDVDDDGGRAVCFEGDARSV